MSLRTTAVVSTGLVVSGILMSMAADTPEADQRAAAGRHFAAGNWRDAYDIFRPLALSAGNSGATLVNDFSHGVQCLSNLQRYHEIDGFRDEVVEAHPNDWMLLRSAGDSLINGPHHGFIVAGEFQRGDQRGGGRYVSSQERDRTRALWLLDDARRVLEEGESPADDRVQLWRSLADALMFTRGDNSAWRLQDLTDLTTLPDYEEAHRGWGHDPGKGAPVDAEDQPVFHTIPESWQTARTDGQRWRWCLEQIARNQPASRATVDLEFAAFLRGQFGVQTMRTWGIELPRPFESEGDAGEDEAGPYAVHTLAETETIARLATGVKRFELPAEFNFIRIYQRLARDESGQAEAALQQLAQIFEDRQQYETAAGHWAENIRRFTDPQGEKRRRLEQIRGNWGRFEGVQSQAAGVGATVDFRFRNGRKVSFTAHRIKVPQLIDDVKAYLNSRPNQLDWQQLQIDNLGYRLVEQDEEKYIGEQVATWDLDLDPRPRHFDRRITITTPLQKAGAYLVVGRMADGNVSRVILWVNDTAIVKKPLDDRNYYFVADARTGAPIPRANVEFFGWRQERIPDTKNQFRVRTASFAELSDADGQVLLGPGQMPQDLQWIAIARTDEGRFAHLGFSHTWFGQYHKQSFNQAKVIAITDRPVYRPAQTMQFKMWMREARYDVEDGSRFANLNFKVKIEDPEGTEVFQQQFQTDEYGGLNGEFALVDDAKLGVYRLFIESQHGVSGGGTFRVEEYKKPEYEVTIEAPDEPVALGSTITATIRAKYYFGAPVTNATVRYKVHRSSYESRWYPRMPWDWLYGEGYWWFSPDYDWYPGFTRWGCRAPMPLWWHWDTDPPELVLDRELAIGPEGTVTIDIDTALAKALHGNDDHQYTITAEVVDASRRTIVGTGKVLVSRDPFRVFVWTARGHYRVGDTIEAEMQARTLDGQGVSGHGELRLLRITYDDRGEPLEQLAQRWEIDTDGQGRARVDVKGSEAGQYRLSYRLTDNHERTIEGAHVFLIRGEGFDGSEFRFNDLELITDKASYAPEDRAELLINTNRVGSTVLLFVRPSNGVYAGPPQILHLEGKSTVVPLPLSRADMPNFFVEAVTIANGRMHTVVREVVVPPEQRVLNVDIDPSATTYKPGETADIQLRLTDITGAPYTGSLVMSLYDRAVEYISGGSNVPEIRTHFWKWRRNHQPNSEDNLSRWFGNLLRNDEIAMGDLGAFGHIVAEFNLDASGAIRQAGRGGRGGALSRPGARSKLELYSDRMEMDEAMPMAAMEGASAPAPGGNELVEPTVRTQFADSAFWKADILTDAEGLARVSLTMPENLTGWKVRVWAMGPGTRVGEAVTEVVTSKNLLVRLQAPRFFTETDEVVLSAIVHNYLATAKPARVELDLSGDTLLPLDGESNAQMVTVPADGEVRVDWRVRATAEGLATVTMKALTDEESDAMQMTFPVYVHGMLKTESFSGVIRPDESSGVIQINVPADRRISQSRLEVRYSPTLAGAMVDALPYLVAYPYGCTEQTLNRFLPTVITQRILQRMGLDLEDIRDKRTNLNAQEIGDDAERTRRWQRYDRNPVFDEAEVARMVKRGVQDLTAMQLSDGGWGWFSGFGEHSGPHTTAIVVHGLQLAAGNDVAIVPGVLDRGIAWLQAYQQEQLHELQLWERTQKKGRSQASDIDALVFAVLVEAGQTEAEMQRILFRDRLKLSLYSQALLGLALHELGGHGERDVIIQNLDQFLTVDDENQTAYLDLPNNSHWWNWYGDTIEANAHYLRLLTRVNPQDPKAAGLVKYLLNNRKHGTYWKSTRDTATCIEALAEFLTASGENRPQLTVEIWMDGQKHREVQITPDNLFSFDNRFVLEGDALEKGPHRIEIRTRGTGPLYFNAYLTNFTTEDFITAAGLEIKVGRKLYKLVQRDDAADVVQGSRGQVIDQRTDKYDRVELPNLSQIVSGDLVEVELEIDSKNDYEYVIFEDQKAAGCEPVDVRSGYTSGGLGAYVEFRDERVAFFLKRLSRGKHSVSYRVRAEIPGRFSALPTRAYAMYAPELRANSDEMKLVIQDRSD